MQRRAFLLTTLLAGCANSGPKPLVLWSKVTLDKPFYDDENADYGVPPTNIIRKIDFTAPTPTHIDGARTITTIELQKMLLDGQHMTMIDALDGYQKVSLPNTYWIPGAGFGSSLQDSLQPKLAEQLDDLTHGDKNRMLVIFCVSRLSWLSHNVVLRAVSLGYRNVLWYRGGSNAWITAGMSVVPVLKVDL